MSEVVAIDIGGTHARFAIARLENGQVAELTHEQVQKVAEHASLQTAWEDYARQVGRPLPRAAGLAVACPPTGEVLTMVNNPWVIRPAQLPAMLGVDRLSIVNDFGAVGYAVAGLGPRHFRHLFGPERDLDQAGVISIVGPGTGLGVAMIARTPQGPRVVETEGGHATFSPVDVIDDQIVARLRAQFGRVSVERIVSGSGLANIHAALGAIEGRAVQPMDDKQLWTLALSGEDGLAAEAFDRFCLSLGAAAGDIALTQGAEAVVIAGGMGLRIADRLTASGFHDRFLAKGRFQGRMAAMPVKLITYPEPGLWGAAAAFAHQHSQG